MYMIAVTSERSSLKWIMTVGIVMTLYSLSYFYYIVPGTDSHYTTGLTEFFIRTRNLDSSLPSRAYFQWPPFFILASIATSVTGLGLPIIEFLFYATIGFLLCTALYVYASKTSKNGGFLAVIAFFIVMLNFLNYQFAPFSLVFGLLLLLFMLESRPRSSAVTITMLVLFVCITLAHAFVALFFVLYLLVHYIVKRDKQYGRLCLLTSMIYFILQFTLAPVGFETSILTMMTSPSEYSSIIKIYPPASIPINSIAQMFSRTVTIAFGITCLVGFILLLVKRKLRSLDKAILITGVVYSGTGIILYTLGTRAIPIIFIPISLGVSYLFESRLRPYFICLFLILLSLVAFLPLHASFADSSIIFQTKEAQTTTDFMIEKYDWNRHSTILSHVEDQAYITPQVEGNFIFYNDFSLGFQSRNIETYDIIIYSVGLAKSLERNNFSEENVSRQISDRFNVIYNSGLSYIAEKSK
jgi:hypothetical protein